MKRIRLGGFTVQHHSHSCAFGVPLDLDREQPQPSSVREWHRDRGGQFSKAEIARIALRLGLVVSKGNK